MSNEVRHEPEGSIHAGVSDGAKGKADEGGEQGQSQAAARRSERYLFVIAKASALMLVWRRPRVVGLRNRFSWRPGIGSKRTEQ
jgi:hypothetical protein